ncbi:MAG: TRAP transporter fused permease subunit [Pseudomonadota bacterium]|nr:TRAP transporter fused permease subunit [Pseudomonadota bacterium]
MSDTTTDDAQRDPRATTPDRAKRIALSLGLVLIVIGMLNNMPGIPGLDDLLIGLTGNPNFAIRKFPYEFLYPIIFSLMMIIVALTHSMGRHWAAQGKAKQTLGFAIDIALVATALAVSLSYLIEIRSVCLIDQFTGERAALIARSLAQEVEFAELYGLPVPTSVEDPSCINTLGVWIFALISAAMIVFLGYNIRVWGLPLVLVAIVISVYTIATVLVWYFYGTDGINKYLVTKLGGEPRQLLDGRPAMVDILVNNSTGLLGQFMAVLINVVFPYLVLGALFAASAGGQSLIKLAFLWTRKLRGGPAHAAIISSALFGTISGGPVVNVMSTGVLTIPMMIKRGFSRKFAGAIEAASSSGGSIMPPVMGVAAFVLAALTAVPYRQVILAALIPALAYYGTLFLAVLFQSRKQGIEAVGEATEEMRLSRADYMYLIMIFAPLLLIVALLMTPKDAIGCGLMGGLLGVQQTIEAGRCIAGELPYVLKLIQNSAGDAGSAGWWAVILLSFLIFLDPDVRRKPRKVVAALANSGVMISTLYLMFLAVSIIGFSLNFTGLSGYITVDVLGWLNSLPISGASTPIFLFFALVLTMVLAVLLGMGMPAVPAYINVALLMGPVLSGLGIANFTAHMFIFYFAIASAITPPVAIAAFAAASVAKTDPMATGFAAVRVGVLMFVIPFIFAFYPELLLIQPAVLDPTPGNVGLSFLDGYDGNIHPVSLAWLLVRLSFAIYLLASALAWFDIRRLAGWEVALRLALAVAVIMAIPAVHLAGIVIGAGLVARQYLTGPERKFA